MPGFWRGFAQGWHAEMDRQEKRRMFEEEMKMKRETTFLSLAPDLIKASGRGLGSSGGSGGGSSSDERFSAAHLSKVLMGYGASEEQVRELEIGGGQEALRKAVDTLSEVEGLTNEGLTQFLDSAIHTVYEVGPYDWTPHLPKGMTFDDFSPEGQSFLTALTPSGVQRETSFTYQFQKPLSIQEQASMRDLLKEDLQDYLLQRQNEALEAVRAGGEAGLNVSLEDSQAIDNALESLKNGSFYGAIEVLTKRDENFGREFIDKWFEHNPQYAEGYYGWAIDNLLNPTEISLEPSQTATGSVPDATSAIPETETYAGDDLEQTAQPPAMPTQEAIEMLKAGTEGASPEERQAIIAEFDEIFGPGAHLRYIQ